MRSQNNGNTKPSTAASEQNQQNSPAGSGTGNDQSCPYSLVVIYENNVWAKTMKIEHEEYNIISERRSMEYEG